MRCGPGADVVNADLTDTVARDCELVGRRLSRDPYGSADAQHETEAEPDSFTFGRTTVAAFQVGRRFDGGATNIGFAVTTNDGASWRSGLLPGLTIASRPAGVHTRASDPVVAYDARHSTWLISTLALENAVTRLAVNRSPDGAVWGDALTALEEPVGQGVAFDKNWVACDNTVSSPYYGRCYLLYTHSADRDMLAVSWSDDGGLTWSAPVGHRRATGGGDIPGDPADRRARRRLPVGDRRSSRLQRRARRTGERRGALPYGSQRSMADAPFAGSARSRFRLPTSTRRGVSGRRGTTASRRVPRGTRSSWRRRPTACSGAPRPPSPAVATRCSPRSASTPHRDGSRSRTCDREARRASTSSSLPLRALRRCGPRHVGCPRRRCR